MIKQYHTESLFDDPYWNRPIAEPLTKERAEQLANEFLYGDSMLSDVGEMLGDLATGIVALAKFVMNKMFTKHRAPQRPRNENLMNCIKQNVVKRQ